MTAGPRTLVELDERAIADALAPWGWDEGWAELARPHRDAGRLPGRVLTSHRGRWLVRTPLDERPAALAGRFTSLDELDQPTTGDWVVVERLDADTPLIAAVLPRRTLFRRGSRGGQPVAANADVVFLVSGLDGDWSPRRLERYLALAHASGAEPVVVLNKRDLCPDVAARVAEARRVAAGAPVVAVSAKTGEGLEALAPWLRPGRTVALLGSSGVGKSSLVNAVLGEERQATAPVRERDGRGRHTTVRRELILVPGGPVLMDTPGMRSLELIGDEDALARAFPDVQALLGDCRFGDCRHDREPGCALRAAVARGELAEDRLEAWRRLREEIAFVEEQERARGTAPGRHHRPRGRGHPPVPVVLRRIPRVARHRRPAG